MDARLTRGTGAWAALAAVLLLLSVLPVAAQAAGRVALVIGNGAYAHVPFLANPGNDARAVGAAFERLGYAVTRLEDAGYDALRRGLLDFTRAASASEVAVVFYAGHGMEVDGRNFLVPVDAALARDTDVEYEVVPLSLVTRAVGGARRLGLVVLDACRDNPFVAKLADAGSTRSIGRGLARVAPSGGTLVAYAAEEGRTAADGEGRNSPYTGALLRYLEEPGLEVGRLFRKVRAEVERTTGGSQTPIEYGKLPDADIYLASGASPPPPPPPPAGGEAKAAYEAAKEVGTVTAYQVVVEDFPGSTYAKLAQAQIDKLGKKPPLVVAGGDAVEEEPPAVAAPSPAEVEKGLDLSREESRLVQTGLAAAGFDPGPADGMIGRGTRGAIRRWQQSRREPATGYLNADEAKALMAKGEQETAVLARALKPGDKLRDCPECPEMVVVPGGTTGRPFAVGVYEVTFREWEACVAGGGCGGYRPSDEGWGRGRRPVVNVSWNDAQAYVEWLSRKTGEAYRLLRAVEWEYAARAGTRTEYWWGDEIGRNRANCGSGCGDWYPNTAPVGSFSANPFGLHDVHGNVYEWVEDCWDGDCSGRVVRGGSWYDGPGGLRSALYSRFTTGSRSFFVGFRVARTLQRIVGSEAKEQEARQAAVRERKQAERERAERGRLQPGTKFRDCPQCPEMVVVPSGSFEMGSPESESGRVDNEGPVHRVTIGHPFAVGVKEVTRGEFADFVSESGLSMGDSCWTYEGGEWKKRSGRHWKSPVFSQTDSHPVVCVDWNDAKAYVRWLSGKTGKEYRLLSESEWEYVARAGTRTARYWGESESGQCRYANGADKTFGWGEAFCDDGYAGTSAAGSFAPNGLGLHDVLGNVWEWVEDCWNERYTGAPVDGSAWGSEDYCGRRVLRGGSWSDVPRNLRSANRDGYTAGVRVNYLGFRVARTLTP